MNEELPHTIHNLVKYTHLKFFFFSDMYFIHMCFNSSLTFLSKRTSFGHLQKHYFSTKNLLKVFTKRERKVSTSTKGLCDGLMLNAFILAKSCVFIQKFDQCVARRTGAVTQRCSIKKAFLQISQNSKENSCAWVSFLRGRLNGELPWVESYGLWRHVWRVKVSW